MAHEKLSPRQKMIGMMYLVLTAMLALNVSKEAVEAFKRVDKGLTLTVANYALKNDLIYKEFDRAAAENPAKAGKYRTTAYEVKQRADEVFNYLQDLKIEIITVGEGPETPAIKGREIEIEAVQRIDDTNIPSEILIGANYDQKAYTLKALVNEYREFLVSTLEGKNETAANSIRASLNTDEGIDHKSGEKEPWETYTFQTLPLVAVVTILSKMQVDVRNAETEVLNFLYGQIDAASFKFNKIEAVVIPKTSNYVTLGSTYEAEVFIAASDTTQQPEILVGDQKLPLDESGKGTYSVRPSSIGSKTWGGVINLRAPDGTIRPYKFDSSYGVGEPNVVVSPTAMNVMYLGIPNPIDVSVPGVGADKIRISVVNGSFTTEKVKNSKGVAFAGNWAVKPDKAGQNVQVVVSSVENGKTISHGTREFRVKPLPKPEARFGGKNSGTISKASATAQAGVFAVMPDFDFDLQWQVTGFTLLYSDRMGDVEATSTSSTLTSQQKDLLNKLARNKDLIIKDIKAKGPDGLPIDLSAVILKIE